MDLPERQRRAQIAQHGAERPKAMASPHTNPTTPFHHRGPSIIQESSQFNSNITAGNNAHINVGHTNTSFFMDGGTNMSEEIRNQFSAAARRQEHEYLEKLKFAKGAAFYDIENQSERCTEGTRVDLLRLIHDWATDPKGPIGFWLRGMAGTGKSTIAQTVAQDLHKRGFIVTSFFFKRGTGDCGSPKLFVPTILRQLMEECPELRGDLISSWLENDLSRNKNVEGQWRTFVQGPLSRIRNNTIYLVIDAVDESVESISLHKEMFDFLSDDTNFKGLGIKIFVTSRPQEEEESCFHKRFVLHDIEEDIVKGDIRRFLEVKFKKFNRRSLSTRNFPEAHHIETLAERSKPLFMAAMTSLRFITRDPIDPYGRYERLISQSTGLKSKSMLDHMYFVVLQQAITGLQNDANGYEDCEDQPTKFNVRWYQTIMGAAVVLRDILTCEELATLLGENAEIVHAFLKQFREILDTPYLASQVRFFHQSLPDFLLDWERVELACSPQHDPSALWVNSSEKNLQIFLKCLDTMRGPASRAGCAGLREDICNLVGPGTSTTSIDPERLSKAIPPVLRYACRHWTAHLTSSGARDSQTCEVLLGFLKKHLLHWIEAMSCLGNLHEAIGNLEQVYEFLQSDKLINKELFELVADSRKFTRYSKDGIEGAPLQVYSSALIFAPESSRVKQTFIEKRSAWIRNASTMDEDWTSTLIELTGHSEQLKDIKFSREEDRMVSLDGLGVMIVWDTTTGATLAKSGATCFDISPSDTLACGGERGEVSLWANLQKRTKLVLDKGAVHHHGVQKLVFAPDGMFLASIDRMAVVIVRDAEDAYRGQRLPQDTLPEDVSLSGPIEFNSMVDGRRFLAIAGKIRQERGWGPGRITVWSKSSSTPWELHRIFTHNGETLISMSLVGTFLVCLCRNPDDLIVWDLTLGDQPVKQFRLEMGSKCRRPRAQFVPLNRGNSIIAPHKSDSFAVYDLSRLNIEKPVANFPKTYTGCGGSLSVSADGTLLAASVGKLNYADQVLLWNITTGELVSSFHLTTKSAFIAPRFSHSGRIIAVSDGSTIRLLDRKLLCSMGRPVNAGPKERIKGHPAISPDGKFLAAVMAPNENNYTTVNIWDAETSGTRSLHYKFESPLCRSQFPCLVFSPARKWLVLVYLYRLDVWDLRDARCHQPRKSYDTLVHYDGRISPGYIEAVFSADSRWFAFAIKSTGWIGILDLDSDEPPEYHYPAVSIDPLRNYVVVALFTDSRQPGFYASLVEQENYEFQGSAEFVRWCPNEGYSTLSAVPDCGSTLSSLHAAALSPTLRMLATVGRDNKELAFIDVESFRVQESYELPYSHLGRLAFCCNGRCLLFSQTGHIHIPMEERIYRHNCSCGVTPVSRTDTQWLLWEGRPFLWLPNSWQIGPWHLIPGNGTLVYHTVDSIFWLRFDRALL